MYMVSPKIVAFVTLELYTYVVYGLEPLPGWLHDSCLGAQPDIYHIPRY
jgi:dipeptide/tripeptide permease